MVFVALDEADVSAYLSDKSDGSDSTLLDEIRVDEQWLRVDEQEMDCGIVVDSDGKTSRGSSARCIAVLFATGISRILATFSGMPGRALK